MATGAYAGDFRDWDQVHTWSVGVIDQLAEGAELERSLLQLRVGVGGPSALPSLA